MDTFRHDYFKLKYCIDCRNLKNNKEGVHSVIMPETTHATICVFGTLIIAYLL